MKIIGNLIFLDNYFRTRKFNQYRGKILSVVGLNSVPRYTPIRIKKKLRMANPGPNVLPPVCHPHFFYLVA